MRVPFLLCVISLGFADYGGGYAGSGFRYGSNAREFALAGALIADNTPGFFAFSNPALLHFAKSKQAGLSYQSMSLDRSIQSLAFVKNLPPTAGMGLAILRAGTDNILGKNKINQFTESFSVQEIEIIISFGVAFTSKFVLGINIKPVFTNIADEYNGKGIAWDLGILYKFHPNLILGGVFENLNGSTEWNLSLGGKDRNYEEFFPKTIALGGSFSGISGITLYFQEDIVISPSKDKNYRTRFGSEIKLANGVKIRAGIKQSQGALPFGSEIEKMNIKPSFGVGLPLKIWGDNYIQTDYALDPGMASEGFSHLFSFSLVF